VPQTVILEYESSVSRPRVSRFCVSTATRSVSTPAVLEVAISFRFPWRSNLGHRKVGRRCDRATSNPSDCGRSRLVQLFGKVLPIFNESCDAFAKDPSRYRWPGRLRISQMQGTDGVWKMTWSFSGLDGSATSEFIRLGGDLGEGGLATCRSKFVDARLAVFVQHEVNERELFGL
jgi:hypothetical protein